MIVNRKHQYKDLDKWRAAKNRQRAKYYHKTQNAPNSKSRYTDEEIEMILNHSIPDIELSRKIGRSVQAIQQKRKKVKGGDWDRCRKTI